MFNVGNRRRIASKGDNKDGTSHSHAFFDPNNKAAKEIRDELALESLEELITWLKQGGRVGIHGTEQIDHCISSPLSFLISFTHRTTPNFDFSGPMQPGFLIMQH